MRIITEAKIQSSAVQWFKNTYCLKHHDTRMAIFSVPNEISMEIRGALLSTRLPLKTVDSIIATITQKMKNMGMMSGVSDTVVVLPNKTLFVEFKTQSGRQFDKQKDFQKTVTDLGHQYHVVRSLEQFKEIIENEIK